MGPNPSKLLTTFIQENLKNEMRFVWVIPEFISIFRPYFWLAIFRCIRELDENQTLQYNTCD